MDELLSRVATRSQLEKALGLNEDQLTRGVLVRIDIENPFEHNFRFASQGTNSKFTGTGFVPGGQMEGIINAPQIIDPRVHYYYIKHW